VHDSIIAYIAQLNADDDLDLLMRRVPEICALRRAECLLSIRISTMLLKMCVARQRTLHFVAELFRAPTRNYDFDDDVENKWFSRREHSMVPLIGFDRCCRCQPDWSPVKSLIEKAVTQAKIKCDMQVLHRYSRV
jgi:hypothetical protein